MTDFDTLREILKEEIVIEIENGYYGKKMVKLHEPPCKEHEGYTVTIRQIPNNSVVIKIDSFPAPINIFNCPKEGEKPEKEYKGECKRADFVIITQTTIKQKTKNLIIFIELKKGKGDTTKIIQQLKGAKCVIAYFRSIGMEFWKQQNFLNPNNYEYRFISIRYIGINKKPSFEKNESNQIHNVPENMLKITSPNYLEFKQLIGK